MEGHDVHHLKTYSTPYPATILDLCRVEQDTGESLRHYIWRFRGVVECIPSRHLRPDPVIVAFYTNVYSMKMHEKLSMHVVRTFDEL